MSTQLNDGDFELDGFQFGGENDAVILTPGGFDPGTTEWRTQDQDSPVGESVMFGRDMLSGPTWAFALLTNQYSVTDALGSLDAMAIAWRGNASRSTPGAVSTLRYNIGGRTRRVYGRPRRWSMAVTPDMWGGVTPVVADFRCVDAMHYDDLARTVNVTLDQAVIGGLMSPLISPLTSLRGGVRSGVIYNVGGNAPAPFVATIVGPVTNPWIAGPGWRMDFKTTLLSSQSLVIDTAPWNMSVMRSDGASLAGSMTRRSTRLSQARLDPAGVDLTFGGTATSTAQCFITWRPTYHSL